jgi:light-regulated signal transduction histidine kinase (bacteriophytochrome)
VCLFRFSTLTRSLTTPLLPFLYWFTSPRYLNFTPTSKFEYISTSPGAFKMASSEDAAGSIPPDSTNPSSSSASAGAIASAATASKMDPSSSETASAKGKASLSLKMDIPGSESVDPHERFSGSESEYTPGDFPVNQSTTQEKVFPIRSVVAVGSPTVLTRRDTVGSDITTRPNDPGGSTGSSSRFDLPGLKSPQSVGRSGSQSRQPFDRMSTTSGKRTPNDYFDIPGRRNSESDQSEGAMSNSRYAGDILHNNYRQSGSQRTTPMVKSTPNTDNPTDPALMTARFKHVVTAEGHSIITGRDGDVLQRCEDEPIHLPGAVQGFGVLVALREDADGKLVVRIVSENSTNIIQYSPTKLFSLSSFTDIMSDENAETFADHLDFIKDEETDVAQEGPEVFSLSIFNPNYDPSTFKRADRNIKLWCAVHISNRDKGLIVCEFELEDDQLHPVVPAGDETPEPPEDTLNGNPTADELAESTTSLSKPLRILRHARKRKGDAAAMEVFSILSQLQEQLAAATSLELFLSVLVGVIKQLTGFHRVMIYQFDETFNGKVVTELVDPRATRDLYKGLHFPASDIPKQARDLYRTNKVRLLYDRDLVTARLCCRTAEDLAEPLDLTHSYLRAMSPIHLKYLANMAVRASMSISITVFDELWGLISCHSYGARGMRVSFPVRKMCRIVGDIASRNIEKLSYASRLRARKLINTIPTEMNPSGYIVASSDDLLNLFDADFGILSIRDETKILGKIQQSQEALAMLEYLRVRSFQQVYTSLDVTEDFPDLVYPPGFTILAGLLLVPLSAGGQDFIAFFRKAQMRTVKWAGNPYEKAVKEGTKGYLEPRKSFKVWNETVSNKCRDWTEEQVETAAVLCLVYGKFIEVWRQKEAALQSSQLTRLLLANASHEVRTPLNAIINYLEIAMEGTLDTDTRDSLVKSHSASKSLIYVINDLLDLTRAEGGQNLIKEELFDLQATIRETTETFRGETERKNIKYDVIEHLGIPQFVKGDQRKVRQALSNLTANAIKHTNFGGIKIEIWPALVEDSSIEIGFAIQDTGSGMSPEKLDILFQELEQVQIEDDSSQLSIESTPTDLLKSKKALGLGLAIVARIVRNMNGQLRLKSEEGKGSRFIIQLPFQLSSDGRNNEQPGKGTNNSGPATPTIISNDGERTLISTSSMSGKTTRQEIGRSTIMRRQSNDSLGSRRSGSSGGSAKSEADRLIDALQGSHMDTRDSSLELRSKTQKQGSESAFPKTSVSSAELHSKRSMDTTKAGEIHVTDEKTPLKPIRVSTDDELSDISAINSSNKRISFGMSTRFTVDTSPPAKVLTASPSPVASPESKSSEFKDRESKSSGSTLPAGSLPVFPKFSILVAEDDPINSRIMQKRLEKQGHKVKMTINGQECANAFAEKPSDYDIVLMDMQVRILPSSLDINC